MYDLNLFADLALDSIDGLTFPYIGPSWMNLSDISTQQADRLKAYAQRDPEYASLVKILGPKNSQDAWHIRTAEIHNLFCFLTMDFKLIKALNAQKGTDRIKGLKTRVLTPIELGKELGLFPINPLILSYTNASFPVRADLSWENGKPRGGRRKKSD